MPKKLTEHLKDLLPLPIRRRFMDRSYGTFLFSHFDGISFDSISWRMATPEVVAKNLAGHFSGARILDAFSGIGGNTIQFAVAGNTVIAVEENWKRFRFLERNCDVYGVRSAVECVRSDAFSFARGRMAGEFDLVYLDPPFDVIDSLLRGDAGFSPSSFWELAPVKVIKLLWNFDVKKLDPLGEYRIRRISLDGRPFLQEAWFFDRGSHQSSESGTVVFPTEWEVFLSSGLQPDFRERK